MNTHTLKKSLLTLGGVFLSSIAAHAQLQTGLLNYWPMEGDATDVAATTPGSASTTADDGTVNGTVTFIDNATAGLGAGFGMAGSFPGGAGNNITILDPDEFTNDIDRSNADLSISAWFLLNNRDAAWQGLIAHGEGTDYRVAVNNATNPIPMSYAGGGASSDITSTSTVGAGPAGDATWHHIVVTTEGSVTQLFLDGVLEASGGTGPINENGQNLLCIGCNPTNGREWNGLIDDVGMWNRALTADEVTQIYDNGVAGSDLSVLLDSSDDDNDGLPNTWEDLYGLDPNDDGSGDVNNGPDGDPDSDNVSNIDEFNNKTFPDNADSDGDNLTDDIETNSGTFGDATDTGTSPLRADSDGDGLQDDLENGSGFFVSATQTGSDPNVADTDGDTMPDGYEVDNGQDPNVDDGGLDTDSDELDNLSEFNLGTNPQDADTDGDGLEDGPEVSTHETDPNNPDSDADNLTDGAEVNTHMTDPNSKDSDGDLFNDDIEIDGGSDPNDPESTPVVGELPEPLLYYSFNVEDGTVVENLGSLETAGALEGGATYGESIDGSFGTAFYGNRNTANDGFVATGFTGDSLGFGAGQTYTAMAWINWAGTSGNLDHMVFGQDDGDGNNAQLHHGIRDDSAPNNIHFGGWGGAQDISDAGAVPVGEWTHVAWQFDGTDKVVYVAGIETSRVAGNNITNPALNVIVGAHGRDGGITPSHSFNGALDEVKIYGEALNGGQIREAMAPGAGSSAALEFRSIEYDAENENVTVTFTSRPGRSYTLLWTPDFEDRPDYSEIDDGVTADPVENITTYTFPAPRPDDDPGGDPVPRAFFIVKQNE